MDKLYWFLSSAVLILFVLLLRAVLGKRMNAGLRYGLWVLVLLRLLIPGTVLHSRVSVAAATDRAMDTAVVQSVDQYLTNTRIPVGAIRDTELTRDEAEQQHPGVVYKIRGYAVDSGRGHLHTYLFRDTLKAWGGRALLCVWYIGMMLVGAYFLFLNLRLYLRLRKQRRPLKCNSTHPVYAVEGLASSCLFLGAIYVSADVAEDETALRCVLAHEPAHAYHLDGFWALLRCAALVLHWFNPLVWYAAKLSQRDSELFADAGALDTLGEETAAHYGETLIRLSTGCPKAAAPLCTATTMCGGKKALRERVTHIARRPRMALWAVIVVLLLSAAAVGSAFAGGVPTEEAPKEPDDLTMEAAPTAPLPNDTGSDDLEQESFTSSAAWDYDAAIDQYAETLVQELRALAVQVTPVSVGGWHKMVSFTDAPQRLAFDLSMELVPAAGTEEELLRTMPELHMRDDRYYYETEVVLTSWDGLHWACDDPTGGDVGWRGYRLLYVAPEYVDELIEDITEAYLHGEVSEQCDLLLWCGEFIPWTQLTQSGQLDAVHHALWEAAVDESYPTLGPINDDHLYRDLYMLYAAAHTDGAFSELFAAFIAYGEAGEILRYSDDCLLGHQYYNDPEAFQYALSILPEQLRLRLSPLLQTQAAIPSPTPLPTAAPELPFASYALPELRFSDERYEGYVEAKERDASDAFHVLEELEGSGCRILSCYYSGTPHGTAASLVVFYPDTAVYLPLPPRSETAAADPAMSLKLSADGKTLAYRAVFPETLTDISGTQLIHRAGTYHYTYDIAARSISLEITT